MPEQKYRDRAIALQCHVLLPGIDLSRPEKQEHYTKNSREWTRSLWPPLCISAPHQLLRQSRRGNLTGWDRVFVKSADPHFSRSRQ